jgi:two-component system, NtrC family, response regulator HydG
MVERDAGSDDADGTELATEARPPPASVSISTLALAVIEGPDAGRSFKLDPESPTRAIVGTGASADFRLTDPSISRRHFTAEPSGLRFRIIDLGSTNGTFVDGTAVVEAFVNGGEILRCGSTAMRLDAERHECVTLPSSAMGWERLVGASTAMRRLYPLCERLASAPIPVLIEGETGTGKEVLAESLHAASRRRGSLVVFDCTAVSPALVESELFGHERGAFTGADEAKPGLLELAEGGTLLIDEIGDLELPLQAKLLRLVDRGEFRRVGGRKQLRVEARLLAATRRDLDREAQAGRFRDDLLHRLAIGRIELPPLRERKGDVTLLARHFAVELGAPIGTLNEHFLAKLEDYAWPGNVRELRNSVLRRIVYGEGAPVGTSATLPPEAERWAGDWLGEIAASTASFAEARRLVIEEFERQFVERVLREHDGNVTRAAEASGIAARYLRLLRAKRSS